MVPSNHGGVVVVDTSVLIAILLDEAEAERLAHAIAGDPNRLVSAFTVLEAGVVLEARKGEAAGRELDLLLHRARIDQVPFTAGQAESARLAWRRFGRGRHNAGLNLGDCVAYALARETGEPLLFKGSDFGKTDVTPATW
jgi:ribonuclease VapC